jgi:hypothetical protein
MRISSRAGAAWIAAGEGEPGTAGIDIVELAVADSREGAVRTEDILDKFLGGWQHAHPYASLYLEAKAVITPGATLSVIKYSDGRIM